MRTDSSDLFSEIGSLEKENTMAKLRLKGEEYVSFSDVKELHDIEKNDRGSISQSDIEEDYSMGNGYADDFNSTNNDDFSLNREEENTDNSCGECCLETNADDSNCTNSDVSNNATKTEESIIEVISTVNESINKLSNSVSKDISLINEKIALINNKVDTLSSVSKGFDALKRSVDANKTNEDRMFEELESYRKNKEFLKIKTYLLNIANIHVEMKETLDEYKNDKETIIQDIGEKGYDTVLREIGYFIDMIESIMQAYCISLETYEVDSEFVSAEQKIIKTEYTESKELNGLVAKVLTPCYKYGDKVLRVAKVICYKTNK